MKLTEEQAAEVRREVALAKNRMDAIRIQAELHDCSLADILEALGEMGANFTVEQNKLRYSDKVRQKVLVALKSGASQAKVAKMYGINAASVSLWAKAAGVTDSATKNAPVKEVPAPAEDSVPAAAVGQPGLQEAVIAVEQLDAALQDVLRTVAEIPDVLSAQELALLGRLQARLQGFVIGYACAMQSMKKGVGKHDQDRQP